MAPRKRNTRSSRTGRGATAQSKRKRAGMKKTRVKGYTRTMPTT